jgi:exodeoxyribonuclease III
MLIATWNINSVRLRLPLLLEWLKEHDPDVVCLQEIKCQTEQFPKEELEAAGYSCAVLGQKGFNGVALLSKHGFEEVHYDLAGDESDEQARFIEGVIPWGKTILRVGGLYLPNGNPVESEKYPYKLAWMQRLIAHAKQRLTLEENFILAGDYNVIPSDKDCYDPKAWAQDALALPATREKFRELLSLGFTDALAHTHSLNKDYTFWDYQAGAFQRNNGIRIDHLLLSPLAADKLQDAGIDKDERAKEKPSDHVPVWVRLKSD